jgi:TonB family protein
MPGFYGGERALKQYVSESIRYPRSAAKRREEGKIYVGFVVDVDGSIKGVKIERGVSRMLDEEAIRVVKNMPKWRPALDKEGKPVPVSYTIPINFSLGNK